MTVFMSAYIDGVGGPQVCERPTGHRTADFTMDLFGRRRWSSRVRLCRHTG